MNGLGLGWAQPLALVTGSLPPLRPAARTALGVVALTWVVACGPAAVGAAPAAPAADPPKSTPRVGDNPSAHGGETMAADTPPSDASVARDSAPKAHDSADASTGPRSAPAASVATGGTPSPDFVRAPSPSAGATPPPTVVTTNPDLARLLALGEGALAREDYAAAVEFFRKARRHAPHSGQAVVGLVGARFGQLALPTEYKGAVGNRDVKELLALLAATAAREPDFGAVYLQQARLQVVLGQATEARVSLGKAKVLLPANAEVHSLLAIVELSEGHVPEALQGFATASELEPHDAERLSNWGTALLLHGDIQQAISVFRRAVGLAPNDARARGDLGTALLAIGDVNQAMPHLQRACELAPTKATFMSNRGYAHQLQADWKSAKQWYDKALAADPKLGSAWINLGTLYAAQQQYDAAEQAFRKALALNPKDPRALGNLDDLASLRASNKRVAQ